MNFTDVNGLARRTQHYGYAYQYKYASATSVTADPVPDFLLEFI